MEKTLSELYTGCRSYRRFEQKKVPQEIIVEAVNTARTRSSAMNAQPLRYVVVTDNEKVKAIQPHLHWAAKLPKEIGTPKENEQPQAFVVVLMPEKSTPMAYVDAGIAMDTIAITAWSHGVGSCILAAVDHDEVAQIIEAQDGYVIGFVVALGYPANRSTIVEPDTEYGLGYYVDEDRNYYVPKRPEDEVIRYN